MTESTITLRFPWGAEATITGYDETYKLCEDATLYGIRSSDKRVTAWTFSRDGWLQKADWGTAQLATDALICRHRDRLIATYPPSLGTMAKWLRNDGWDASVSNIPSLRVNTPWAGPVSVAWHIDGTWKCKHCARRITGTECEPHEVYPRVLALLDAIPEDEREQYRIGEKVAHRETGGDVAPLCKPQNYTATIVNEATAKIIRELVKLTKPGPIEPPTDEELAKWREENPTVARAAECMHSDMRHWFDRIAAEVLRDTDVTTLSGEALDMKHREAIRSPGELRAADGEVIKDGETVALNDDGELVRASDRLTFGGGTGDALRDGGGVYIKGDAENSDCIAAPPGLQANNCGGITLGDGSPGITIGKEETGTLHFSTAEQYRKLMGQEPPEWCFKQKLMSWGKALGAAADARQADDEPELPFERTVSLMATNQITPDSYTVSKLETMLAAGTKRIAELEGELMRAAGREIGTVGALNVCNSQLADMAEQLASATKRADAAEAKVAELDAECRERADNTYRDSQRRQRDRKGFGQQIDELRERLNVVKRERDAAIAERGDLPHIKLDVSGDVFRAAGDTKDGIHWSIYAEAENEGAARCGILVDGDGVADVSVHSYDSERLVEETQEVCAAIVWSAIRTVRTKRVNAGGR